MCTCHGVYSYICTKKNMKNMKKIYKICIQECAHVTGCTYVYIYMSMAYIFIYVYTYVYICICNICVTMQHGMCILFHTYI